MKLFVKKIWSTHPDLFLYLELDEAEKQYKKFKKHSPNHPYDFDRWLRYEIDTQPKRNQKCICCGGSY